MKRLSPKVFDHFSCIGPDCPMHCCQGWQVTIDRLTINKFKELPPGELRDSFLNSLEDSSVSGAGEKLKRIKFDERGFCPVFSESGLCRVHAELGEEYLSKTCSVFPRITRQHQDVFVRYVELGCPEVVRHLMDDPSASLLEEQEHREQVGKISKSTKIIDQDVFRQLLLFFNSWIGNRKNSLPATAVYLAMFAQNISKQKNKEAPAHIYADIPSRNNILSSGIVEEKFNEIVLNFETRKVLFKEYIEILKSTSNSFTIISNLKDFFSEMKDKAQDFYEVDFEGFHEKNHAKLTHYMTSVRPHFARNMLNVFLLAFEFPGQSFDKVFERYFNACMGYFIWKQSLLVRLDGIEDPEVIHQTIYETSYRIGRSFLRNSSMISRVTQVSRQSVAFTPGGTAYLLD